MSAARTIFGILRDSSDPAADAALLTALEHADPSTAHLIIQTLLDRKTRIGLYGMVARMHLMDEPLRQFLSGQIDTLFSVLREAAQSRNEQIHLNAVEMIRRGRAYRASYLLEGALHDPAPRVREAAAETLVELARTILNGPPDLDPDAAVHSLSPEQVRQRMEALESYAEDRRQFAGAVEAGLTLFEVHRRTGVVEAAMWLADDLGPKFWTMMSAPNSRVAQVALRIIQRGFNPRLVPFALAALSYSQFRPYVVAVLSQCTDPAVLAEWVAQSWRLLQPKAARGMAAIRELACLERRAADLLRLPPNVQPAISRWLLPTGLPTECKIDALLHVLYRGDPAARTAVVWGLTRYNDEATVPLLRNLTSDSDPDLRRLAIYELARRRPWEFPVADLLAPGTSVDALPQRPLPDRGMTFERYWGSFDRLDDNERITAGRDMLDAHPDATTAIRLRLNDPEPAGRIRALSIIRTLELAETFADDLFRLCHDPNPEIRSNVISVLATNPGGTARRIFHAALSDQDPRVRANAVEAIERIGDQDLTDLLLPMLGSPDNRVRANAVRALLKQGVRPAAETLLKMLDDPDRAQRISALWLVEQMGLLALAARISRIAACDQDPAVRLRAQRLVQHLGQQITATLAPEPETQRVKEVAAL